MDTLSSDVVLKESGDVFNNHCDNTFEGNYSKYNSKEVVWAFQN